jgi:predicted dehydrogenase
VNEKGLKVKRLRMAVIGVGHLGKEHARILAGLPEVELVGVADLNQEHAQAVAHRLNTQAFSDYWPLLNLVDAACIAVPTSQHVAVAREFLRRGIPLLIEKPLAADLAGAEELTALARQTGTLLQVGHIERFNPAFEELQRRTIRPLLVRAQRLGPFTGRSTDVGVVLDLMIHDLDLLLDLVRAPVRSVAAAGVSVFGGHEDVATARLEFTNGCCAELMASRATAVPARVMQVWAAEGYAELDFAQRRLTLVQPSEEVRRRGLDPAQLDPASRACLREELFGRHLETRVISGNMQDQLSAELQDFVACVRSGAEPRVTGTAGRDAIALAGAILHEIRTHAWDEASSGLRGPHQLPSPHGPLFQRDADQEVA